MFSRRRLIDEHNEIVADSNDSFHLASPTVEMDGQQRIVILVSVGLIST